VRLLQGYYDGCCNLPFYNFCGRHLLAAKLRPSNLDGAAGAREEVERLVAQIRTSWLCTQILLRADGGFCSKDLGQWCHANRIDYLFGLARNDRLVGRIEQEPAKAAAESRETGKTARRFTDLRYITLTSSNRARHNFRSRGSSPER